MDNEVDGEEGETNSKSGGTRDVCGGVLLFILLHLRVGNLDQISL